MPKAKQKSLVSDVQGESFKALQDRFYKKIKDEFGFIDIEETGLPDRPLKEWHGLKYSSENALQKIAIREEYQKVIDSFTNHKNFEEICIPKPNPSRGNKLKTLDIKEIWRLSTQEGLTERKIAIKMKVSKTSIHYVLERLRKWMEIL
jgi:predicted DNA-binding protein (UPF0251 family)